LVALDKDRDGELSAEEIKDAVKALKALDKNGDGKLDRAELRPPRRPEAPDHRGHHGPPPPRDGRDRPPPKPDDR
jgi:Ca2+-binding EF-hand superfamily protein